uniref:Uncharacterized protein n=1 Tax=Arundo donax TaxID=35708 RepID=A0A0A9F831_ARUDO
MRCVFCAV